MTRSSLPKFTKIDISKVESEIDQILKQNELRMDELLSDKPVFTWENLLAPMEEMNEKLSNYENTIAHLNRVRHSPELHEILEKCWSKSSAHESKQNQNMRLHNAVKSIKDNIAYFNTLSVAQKSAIDKLLKKFCLSGVHLPDAEKKRIAQLKKEIEAHALSFDKNITDSEKWSMHIIDEEEMAGIPAYIRESAREEAAEKNLNGWIITLTGSNVIAILTHADSSKLRQEIHRADKTRASCNRENSNEGDNYPIMHEILKKRAELATLLGLNNYAKYSLQTKMWRNTEEVMNFLNDIVQETMEQARVEYAQLVSFAASDLGIAELRPWDIAYASEKLRKKDCDFSEEELRPYFSESCVFDGLRGAMEKLYDVTLRQADDVDVWHKDVKFYDVVDNKSGTVIGGIFYDLYARKNKNPSAWTSLCRARCQLDGSIQLPVVYVNCNFHPPADGKPALLLPDDVVTFFHETGHALQNVLTRVDIPSVSGIRGIPEDAKEIASHFFENWAREKESLSLFAKHYETNSPIPDALFDRMKRARTFQSAIDMTVQLLYGLFDFRLHMEYDPANPQCLPQIL